MASSVVLIEGRPNDHPLGPTGTVGLCAERHNKVVILIDAGDPWNGKEIIDRLKEFNVESCVSHVIITHGHLDHCANLGLFPDAVQIMDSDIAVRENGKANYSVVPQWPYRVSENVEIMQLSGHTAADTILIAREQTKTTTVFAGDLVEDYQEFVKFQESQLDLMDNEEDELLLSQEFIFSSGNRIVPGHGSSFSNPFHSYFLFFSFWRRFMR